MPLFTSDSGAYVPVSSLSTDGTMTANSDGLVATQQASKTADVSVYNLTRRKNYVSGVLKVDSFIYASKASTAGGAGVVTFYITSDGTSGGTAVFTNVYADSVAVGAYGSSGNYQAYNLAVAGDKKSVTATIGQITNVLGIATIAGTAANGIDCRLYVMGD